MSKNITIIDKDYKQWVAELSARYRQSQIRAAVKVNSEMLRFYYYLGRDILAKQAEARWGSKFFECLSRDLKAELPEAKCFSAGNLLYMKNFYRLYSPFWEITPQVAEQFKNMIFSIPWGHHCFIMDKCILTRRYPKLPQNYSNCLIFKHCIF